MKRQRKQPTPVFRAWRWESEHTGADSVGHIRIQRGLIWTMPDHRELAVFIQRKHLFAVCIRATMMHDDDIWELTSQLYPDAPLLINDFEEVYQEQRRELLSGAQTQHIVDVGWVIQTYPLKRKEALYRDDWWQVGRCKASMQRQQLWRYYHKVIMLRRRVSREGGFRDNPHCHWRGKHYPRNPDRACGDGR